MKKGDGSGGGGENENSGILKGKKQPPTNHGVIQETRKPIKGGKIKGSVFNYILNFNHQPSIKRVKWEQRVITETSESRIVINSVLEGYEIN